MWDWMDYLVEEVNGLEDGPIGLNIGIFLFSTKLKNQRQILDNLNENYNRNYDLSK